MKKTYLLLGGLVFIASCTEPAATEEANTEDEVARPVEETIEIEPSLSLIWESNPVLITNESILLSEDRTILYVSNVSGNPTEKDGVGSISKVDMDGVVTESEWAKDIDAPKGMGILVDKMYVTNIDELVEVNLADGKITKGFTIKDAEFLNDVVVDNGKVYFSDMNTGKIHMYDGTRISLFSEGHDGVNGLDFYDGHLYALDNSGLIKVSMTGEAPEVINAEITGGDGLVVIDESTFIASRWVGEIWLIKDGKTTMLLDSKAVELNTADICYNKQEKTLYVPRFFGDKISAYRLTY